MPATLLPDQDKPSEGTSEVTSVTTNKGTDEAQELSNITADEKQVNLKKYLCLSGFHNLGNLQLAHECISSWF